MPPLIADYFIIFITLSLLILQLFDFRLLRRHWPMIHFISRHAFFFTSLSFLRVSTIFAAGDVFTMPPTLSIFAFRHAAFYLREFRFSLCIYVIYFMTLAFR
jgi:hypothetical protein